MKERKSFIEIAMDNYRIVILIITSLIMFGVYALINMPRQEFPQFTIRQGLILGVYPGATSNEVEEQLTDKIESYLFSYKEVNKKKTYSYSRENVMVVFVELNDNIDERESKEFWLRIQDGLNSLKPQLPSGVSSLTADNDFGDTSALLLSIESEQLTYREMEEQLKLLEKELRKISSVSKVKHFGLQKEQIKIYLQNEKLSYYGLKPMTVFAAFKTEGSVNYSGEIDDGKVILPVHIPAKYHSELELGEQIIFADPSGKVIRLKDVARLERGYQEPESFIKSNGKKCLIVSLEMQPGNNIVQFGKEVDQHIKTYTKKSPSGLVINKIANQPKVVNDSVTNFLKEFMIAIIAVILVTMLLLPLRIASVAGSTIPISILISFGALYLLGVELHTVSLASLIVVLGMVVDNAIVVIDSYVEKLDSGKSRKIAAIESIKELFIPVVTATLAILAAFLPMLFILKGMSGDFIKTFPITISVALISSLIVVTLLLPFMNYKLIKQGIKKNVHKGTEANKKVKPNFLDKMQNFYDKTLTQAFKKPMLIIFGSIIAFIIGVLVAKSLPMQSFPKVERNQFAVEIYMPVGTSLQANSTVVDSLEKILLMDKRIETVTSFTGSSSPRFHLVYAPNMPGKNYSQMIVNTVSEKATEEILDEYDKKYRNYFPNAYVKWKQLEMAPLKNPIDIRISGDDIPTIKKVATRIETMIHQDPRVAWVKNDYDGSARGIDLNVLTPQANQLGYTNTMISTSLAICLKGFPITTLWEGDYPVDVLLTNDKDKKNSISDLENTYITSPIMQTVNPIRQLAEVKESWSEGTIVRRNGVPTLTIIVDVNRGVIPSKVFNQIIKNINAMKITEDVSIVYGGDKETESEVYPPMLKSLLISIFLIFFILLFQFRRIRLSLLIMTTMPLGLIGTALGLKLMGYPFAFTAFVGFISLCGVVVRNGIIMVGYAEEKRLNDGMTALDAAITAGKRRMRPIFLTSASAAVGVIPMIASRSLLWGPLSSVICFGLLFSMILTLYLVPVLYWYLMRGQDGQFNSKIGDLHA